MSLTALPTSPAATDLTACRLGLAGTFARVAANLAADPGDVFDAVPDRDLDLVGDLAELVASLVEALAWRNQAATLPAGGRPPAGVATGHRLDRLLYAARAAALLHRDADSAPDGALSQAV